MNSKFWLLSLFAVGLITMAQPAMGQPRDREGREDGGRGMRDQPSSREQALERQVRELQEQMKQLREAMEKAQPKPEPKPQSKAEAPKPPKGDRPDAKHEESSRAEADRDGWRDGDGWRGRGRGYGQGYGWRGRMWGRGGPWMGGYGWRGTRECPWGGPGLGWGRGFAQGRMADRQPGAWASPQAAPAEPRGPGGDIAMQVRMLVEDARRLLAKAEMIQQQLQRGPGGPAGDRERMGPGPMRGRMGPGFDGRRGEQ